MPVPVFAAFVFGICGLLAAGSAEFALREFAVEAGISSWIFMAVPGLFAALFALLVYQGAVKQVKTVSESLSRGLLVAILTWIAFSVLSSAVWCAPSNRFGCFSNILMLSGVIGGGPMLAGALIAGGAMGWILKRRVTWLHYS